MTQTLHQPALLDFFEVDLRPIGQPIVLRYVNTSQSNNAQLRWAGQDWIPYPIDASGFELTASGSIPTPTVRVANVFGAITGLILAYQGLIGAKVTRYKVFETNLDTRQGANPNDIENTQIWYIARYTENATSVTFTLRHPLELQNVKIPRRRMSQILD
jgi:lambda family phage minor tail protein L